MCRIHPKSIRAAGKKSHRERGPVQCGQHTVKTFIAQHEDR